MFWHTDPYDYCCIYYMKTNIDNGGTLFTNDKKEWVLPVLGIGD